MPAGACSCKRTCLIGGNCACPHEQMGYFWHKVTAGYCFYAHTLQMLGHSGSNKQKARQMPLHIRPPAAERSQQYWHNNAVCFTWEAPSPEVSNHILSSSVTDVCPSPVLITGGSEGACWFQKPRCSQKVMLLRCFPSQTQQRHWGLCGVFLEWKLLANGFIFVLTSNCCLVYLWLVIYVKHDISILLQWKCKDSCMDFAGIQDWTGLIFTAKILQDQPRWDRDFGEKKKEKDKKIRIEHADIQSLTQSGFSRDTRDSVGWLLYYLFFLSSL